MPNDYDTGSSPSGNDTTSAERRNQYSIYDKGPDPEQVAKRLGLFTPLSDRSTRPDARQ